MNELGRRENTIQRRLEGGAMGQKNTEYEFGGPLGALGVIVFMPLVCFWLFAQCGERGCDLTRLPTLEGLIPATSEIVTAALVLKAYVLLTVALHLILPGKRVEGVKLSDGNRLQYKLNGTFPINNIPRTQRPRSSFPYRIVSSFHFAYLLFVYLL